MASSRSRIYDIIITRQSIRYFDMMDHVCFRLSKSFIVLTMIIGIILQKTMLQHKRSKREDILTFKLFKLFKIVAS